jgi:hypothetical protein
MFSSMWVRLRCVAQEIRVKAYGGKMKEGKVYPGTATHLVHTCTAPEPLSEPLSETKPEFELSDANQCRYCTLLSAISVRNVHCYVKLAGDYKLIGLMNKIRKRQK